MKSLLKFFRLIKPNTFNPQFFLIFLFLSGLIGFLFFDFSFANEKDIKNFVSIGQLIENANDFNLKVVTVRGEAIGDLMKRRDGAWLNISDGTAIGIFFKKGEIEAPSLQFLGDYQNKGDILEVTGVFHKACEYHKGELDIHAKTLKIVEPGYKIYHPVSEKKISLVVFLSLGALLIFLLKKLLKLE